MSIIRVADGVHFYVLGKAGILFSEAQQKIHSFNPVASFVWCCLEEGLSTTVIAKRFADTFATAEDEAKSAIAEIFHRWQGQGYIAGVDIPGPNEIDLTTALGRLLINPELRKAFATSPNDTAACLSIRQKELDVFLALNPQDLAQQAKALWYKKTRYHNKTAVNNNIVTSSFLSRFLKCETSPVAVRYYRLANSNYCLRYHTVAQELTVHPVFAHLEINKPENSDFVLDIVEQDIGHILLRDGTPIEFASKIEEIAPLLTTALATVAAMSNDLFLKVHAGVIIRNNQCIVLPASAGSGKTTLTAALISSGFQYFSDEVAFIDMQNTAVHAMPVSLSIKPSVKEPLLDYYPEINMLPLHLRDDGGQIRCLNPPPESTILGWDNSFPLSYIIFPQYESEVATSLQNLDPSEAFDRLMPEIAFLGPRIEANHVAKLIRILRTTPCFQLSVSSLPDAIKLIRNLTDEKS